MSNNRTCTHNDAERAGKKISKILKECFFKQDVPTVHAESANNSLCPRTIVPTAPIDFRQAIIIKAVNACGSDQEMDMLSSSDPYIELIGATALWTKLMTKRKLAVHFCVGQHLIKTYAHGQCSQILDEEFQHITERCFDLADGFIPMVINLLADCTSPWKLWSPSAQTHHVAARLRESHSLPGDCEQTTGSACLIRRMAQLCGADSASIDAAFNDRTLSLEEITDRLNLRLLVACDDKGEGLEMPLMTYVNVQMQTGEKHNYPEKMWRDYLKKKKSGVKGIDY